MNLEQINEVKAIAEMVVASKQGYFYLWMVILFVLSGAGGYFAAYLKMKGENKATKEDIGEITEKVKAIESKFDKETAKLASDLEQKSHFNKFRYEKEAAIYGEVWPCLEELKLAIQLLPPLENALQKVDHNQAKANQKRRFEDVLDAMKKTNIVLNKYRPFFPADLWSEIFSFRKLVAESFMKLKDTMALYTNLNDEEVAVAFQKHTAPFEIQIDAICDAIRKRLTEFDALN